MADKSGPDGETGCPGTDTVDNGARDQVNCLFFLIVNGIPQLCVCVCVCVWVSVCVCVTDYTNVSEHAWLDARVVEFAIDFVSEKSKGCCWTTLVHCQFKGFSWTC